VGGPGGRTLSDVAVAALLRTVVDTDLNQPDMVEFTFRDDAGDLIKTAGLSIGMKITVSGQGIDSTVDTVLITGEVTAFEARYENLTSYLIVRGYDLTHRLQRVRRSRTFLRCSDSDIARTIAHGAGLTELEIEPSEPVHDHIGQVDETDWDFLTGRAREIGFEVGITAGLFFFRRASTVAGARRPPVELTFRESLRWFRPRVTAGNLAPSVEVRVWDPMQAKVLTRHASARNDNAKVSGHSAAHVAGQFVSRQPPRAPIQPAPSAVGDLGPAPDPTALVVSDRPLAVGSGIDPAAAATANGLAARVGGTFAEAEGDAIGDPAIHAGGVVSVAGVADVFGGPWLVTSARHVFDVREGGYRTRFVASGHNDRSLLALTSAGTPTRGRRRLHGLYCGIVTNNFDRQRLRRVKVALPWLSPDFETDWAPVVQLSAGRRSGAMFLPEVGDEIVVGFEFGDSRRPYVLGGIVNAESRYWPGEPIKAEGQTAQVAQRGIVSPSGNHLLFTDQVAEPGSPPRDSTITLATGSGSIGVAIDQVAGTLTVSCAPRSPDSKTEQGTIEINCPNGNVKISTGSAGTVAIDAGEKLDIKAQGSISIQSTGELQLKGAKITLN
jgi:phage protein D/phage baseplate assembly protein gpV